MNRLRRWRHLLALAGLVLAVLGVAPVVAARPASADAPALTGGGSGFAALEVDTWKAAVNKKPFSLKINYSATGSSFGRQQFGSGQLDFGTTDIPYLDEELPAVKNGRCHGRGPDDCFAYVPVSAGGVAFMFNLKDNSGRQVTDLKLTREEACKVFTGAITKWNDPQLVSTNPALGAINRDIRPIVRSDGAGESYVLSEFCIAVERNVWQAFINDRVAHAPNAPAADFVAGRPVSNWPQEWGHATTGAYADGVANQVADSAAGKDAITYVAAGYAKVRNMPVASLENAAGKFTQPDEDNVTVALGYAQGRGNGTFALNFTGPDPRAYFPSTYSYVLAQTTDWDPAKGAALSTFLCYAISKGQEIAPQLRYARLSAPLVALAITQIVKIPGAVEGAKCFIAGSAPPPAPPTVKGGPGGSGGGGGGSGGADGGDGSGGAGGGPGDTGSAGPDASTGPDASADPDASDSSGGPNGSGGPEDVDPTATEATGGPVDGKAEWTIAVGGAGGALGIGLLGIRRRPF